MTIVVDTTVIIAVVTNEAHKPALLAATQDADLIAPPSLHWEIGNAFSAMFKRKRLTLREAAGAIDLYLQIPIRVNDIDLQHAVRLASDLQIYAYDAYMIACAEAANCPLITLDGGLRLAAQRAGVGLVEVMP
jgi:predicted nucleic acid-binding protein